MFGGVADRYSLYTLAGEPYKKAGNPGYYVKVIHPITKMQKEVKWYTDKAHAANTKNTVGYRPFYQLFKFKTREDHIQIIRKADLTEEEIEKYFYYDRSNPNGWLPISFFGMSWFAAKETPIPPIKNKDKVFLCSWAQFKAEGIRKSRADGADENCRWFKEE